MKKMLIALSFFTRIPINIKKEVSEDEFYASMALLPVVGLIIGAILYGVAYGVSFIGLNSDVSAFVVLFFYIWLTGGLHIDGFIDAIDALLSNRDREKMLEIMKDSRIGAFGALGIILLLLGYFIIFKYVPIEVFLLMPVVGRSCALMAASLSSYAKETNDLGRRFIEDMGKKEMWFAIIFSVGLIGIVNYYYLLPFIFCLGLTYYYVKQFQSKLFGMTGDTIGLLIELNQVVFLYIAYIVTTIIMKGGVL